jgi:hypothetical protein
MWDFETKKQKIHIKQGFFEKKKLRSIFLNDKRH